MSTTPPLLAILLITSSDLTSPNKHLLFHYPPNPTHQSSQDEEIPDDSSSDTSSTTDSSSSDSTTSTPSSKYSRQTGDKGYTIEDDEDHHDGFDRDEDDDVRTSSWHQRKSRRLTEWEQPVFGLSKRDLADILIPKDPLCNRKFELGLEDLVFLGHPVHLNEAGELSNSGTLATSPSSSINDDTEVEVIVSKVRLTKFHIVFVMNPSWRLDYHDQVQKMYNEIIQKFTETCVAEQKEKGFISLEAFKINKIMRDAEEKELPMSMVWEEIIKVSNLASAIATLYNSIIDNRVAFIDLNDSVELAFHVKQVSQISSLPEIGTITFPDNNIPLLSTAHGFGEQEEDADQVVAPKYTLLLMDEPEAIIEKLPKRQSTRSQNWSKILTISPFTTFKKLSREQRIPLSLVMSMARELINLDMARAMPPLSNRGVYIVSPLAPMTSLQSQSGAFAQRFPSSPSLITILSTMSSGAPKRWETLLLIHRLPAEVLPWLMRFGWITQLRQFYFIRIPRSIKLSCISPHLAALDRRPIEQRDMEDSILINPFRASREEVRWIRALVEQIGGPRGRTFERLCKYFDGKSAKDKILRREQVERAELEGMIEAFRKIGGVVVAEHW